MVIGYHDYDFSMSQCATGLGPTRIGVKIVLDGLGMEKNQPAHLPLLLVTTHTTFSPHLKQFDLLKVGKETSVRRTTLQVTLTNKNSCNSESEINYSLNGLRKSLILN